MYAPRISSSALLVAIGVIVTTLSVAAEVEFGEVVRISPAGRLAMSPDLIVDASGVAHVLWVDKGADGTAPKPVDPDEIKSEPGMKHDAFDDLYYRRYSPTKAGSLGEPALVNTARGGLFKDLDIIEEGLKSGQLGGLGTDVLPSEPPVDHPLISAWREDAPWLRDRLVITPHTAYYSETALYDMRYLAAETAALFLNQKKLRNRII